MLYYVIKNKLTNEILKRADGSIVKEQTIKDCLEYLWYILKLEDTSIYEFILRTDKKDVK